MRSTNWRDDGRSNHIAGVVHAGLCHSCGACRAVCPVEAVSFRESVGGHLHPVVDDKLCTECGLCLSVCAGIAAKPSFVEDLPDDAFTGVCLGSWVGRSQDPQVYEGGQSGGVVSQLLLHLLDAGEIDACAVVKMTTGSPPRPTAFLARDRQEILEAQKSKYCPIPLLPVVKEAESANWRIAMVGLACHFHALNLIESAGIDVRSIVKLKIGLICDRVLTLAAVDFLLDKASQRDRTAKLVFRDKYRTGYPGAVTIADEMGNVSILPKSERLAIKDIFTPARCRLCFDKMNVLADVTIGDPWGIEGADRQNGESVVVARTEAGRCVVERAFDNGDLSLRPVAYSSVLVGQGINRKRADWRAYCEVWDRTGQELPGFYKRVVRCAPAPGRHLTKYRRRLRRGLGLDMHGSRKEVLSYARWIARLLRVRAYLSKAVALARRLFPKETRPRKGNRWSAD